MEIQEYGRRLEELMGREWCDRCEAELQAARAQALEKQAARKAELMFWHRQLVRRGYLWAARKALRLLRTGLVWIGDGDDESYESGLATWLLDHCRWRNRGTGVVVTG